MELNRRLPRFTAKIDALQGVLGKFETERTVDLHDALALERALMQMQVEWELFVRGLILDSATGNFSNIGGPVVSSHTIQLSSREQACHYLITQYPRTNKEPNWYVPTEAIRAASLLGVSNIDNISAQLGVSPWQIDSLRQLRNFIGHRSKASALKVRELGLVGRTDKIDAIGVAFSFNEHGTRNYSAWGQFMKYIARQLAI
tara:strand:+ start:2502 stop:3107 length:606 start_codon:yes stop_codon:yes gene_type:complete